MIVVANAQANDGANANLLGQHDRGAVCLTHKKNLRRTTPPLTVCRAIWWPHYIQWRRVLGDEFASPMKIFLVRQSASLGFTRRGDVRFPADPDYIFPHLTFRRVEAHLHRLAPRTRAVTKEPHEI